MKKINNALIYVLIISSLCLGFLFFNPNTLGRSLSSFLIIPVLFVPRLFRKIFKLNISDLFEFIYILYIIIIEFLGCAFNLYNTIFWYDILAHFLTGVFASIISLIILNWFKNYNPKNVPFNAFFILCFNIFVSGFWEILEFFTYLVLKIDVQHNLDTGVFDTMEDMLIAFLGGIIIFVFYLIDKNKKNSFFNKIRMLLYASLLYAINIC